MNQEKERDIQRACLDYLAIRKVFNYKNNTSGIYKQATGSYIPSQSAGAPDIICIIKGRYVGLEIKRPNGIQSEKQKEFQENILNAGGAYFIVRSIDECMDVIESFIGRTTN